MSRKNSVFFSLICVVVVIATVLGGATKEDLKKNVKHLIIFMQENRPLDHYFGTLKGVRGFNDRAPAMLRSGRDAFFQPIEANNDETYMLPFHTLVNETNAMCMPAPEMYYPTDIKMWNHGYMDAWNTARDPGYGMAYFRREDLPYYYTLYDNFLMGDQYYQSTFTSTNPNRMFLFTGCNGLSVDQGCILDNSEPRPGYNWTTAAEILENAQISWKVYQQLDNFDDNAFAWFTTFQQSRPGNPFFDKGMKRQLSLFEEMEKDMKAGTLPAVSWVIAPTRKSEHATNHPCAGEDFTARLLKLLERHPDIYRETVFILNYDEGGQFYDHAIPPTPPILPNEGFSSVDVHGEVNTITFTTADQPQPIGLGFRVPILIVSPWTRGNLVYSEVLDHTSVLQFMEEWLDINVTNISPWRRLVTGNLLAAFDFAHPDYSWPRNLPDTSDYVKEGDIECRNLPDPIIPVDQSMPKQEPGTRIARALPYQVEVADEVYTATDGSARMKIDLVNSGSEGIPLSLYNLKDFQSFLPRKYALAADSTFHYREEFYLGESTSASDYAFVLYGPNGFLREFRGSLKSAASCAGIRASVSYDITTDEVIIHLANKDSAATTTVVVEDQAYGLFEGRKTVALAPNSAQDLRINVSKSARWYDFTVAASETEDSLDTSCFYRRFMGHMENGKDSTSDPAMGEGKAKWLELLAQREGRAIDFNNLAKLPAHLAHVERKESIHAKYDKDARFYSKDFTNDPHIEF